MAVTDNYDLFRMHERKQEEELEKLPKCDYCGEEITDEYFYLIYDEYICKECLKDNFRKRTSEYTRM